MNTMQAEMQRVRRQLVSGNRMAALGAAATSCRFFSGYPITPSSEIYRTIMEGLPRA